jgi:putative oxidoreductase
MTVINPSNPLAPAPNAAEPPAGYAAVLGRVLMSVIFLLSGAMKIMHLSGMAAMLHMSPAVLGLAGAAELAGGLSLLLGLWSRVGALGLFIFLIPTTLMFHNFWAAAPDHQQEQMAHFLKNLAIMGGLLMIAAYGPGPLSITPVRRTRV